MLLLLWLRLQLERFEPFRVACRSTVAKVPPQFQTLFPLAVCLIAEGGRRQTALSLLRNRIFPSPLAVLVGAVERQHHCFRYFARCCWRKKRKRKRERNRKRKTKRKSKDESGGNI